MPDLGGALIHAAVKGVRGVEEIGRETVRAEAARERNAVVQPVGDRGMTAGAFVSIAAHGKIWPHAAAKRGSVPDRIRWSGRKPSKTKGISGTMSFSMSPRVSSRGTPLTSAAPPCSTNSTRRASESGRETRTSASMKMRSVGSSPYGSPAVLCGIAHMQTDEGVWYPVGGTRAVPEALVKLATELGVQFRTGTKIEKILSRGGEVTGVLADAGEEIALSCARSDSARD